MRQQGTVGQVRQQLGRLRGRQRMGLGRAVIGGTRGPGKGGGQSGQQWGGWGSRQEMELGRAVIWGSGGQAGNGAGWGSYRGGLRHCTTHLCACVDVPNVSIIL